MLSKLEEGEAVFSDGEGGNGMRNGVLSGRNRMCCPPLFLVPSRSLAGNLSETVSASEPVCHKLKYGQLRVLLSTYQHW